MRSFETLGTQCPGSSREAIQKVSMSGKGNSHMSSKKFKPKQKNKEQALSKPQPGKTTIRQANPFVKSGKSWFFSIMILMLFTAITKIISNILSMTTSDAYIFFAVTSGVLILLMPMACLVMEVCGIRDCINDLRYGGEGRYLILLIVEMILTMPWIVYTITVLGKLIMVSID